MQNRSSILVMLFMSVLAITIAFTSCSKKEEVKDDQAQATAPQGALVEAVKSLKLDVPWDIEYPAQVAGSLEVEIRAQVGGILKERLYQEGEYVKKGDILFKIDPEQPKAALEKAEASLAQVNTEVQRTQRDYIRMKELIKDNAVSQKDYDDSLSAYEKAQANYKAAKAVVDDARINLGYTTVKAPISGIARKETHSVGSLVSTIGSDALLTTMVQINPLYVNFSIPARHLAGLKKQYDAKSVTLADKFIVDIVMPDGSVYKDPGEIIFVDSAEDPLTSAVAVKVQVQNPNFERTLTPGQYVKVRLKGVSINGAVVVPQSALVDGPTGTSVYVVNTSSNNIVEKVAVSAQVKDSIAVIMSGLQGGETIVSGGSLKVRPGMPVNPEVKEFALPENIQEAYKKQYGDASQTSIEPEKAPICQSCSMPMTDEKLYGTEADGSKTKEYCKYCYKNGKFNLDKPLDEFTEICVKMITIENDDITEDQARQYLKEKLPTLKRWNAQK